MFELRLAKIISWICHPLLMPTYVLIMLFNMNIYYSFVIADYSKLRILGLIFITTFVLPLMINLIFLRNKLISSLYLRIKEERVLPFIVTGVFYYMTYELLKQLFLPDFYKLYMLGASFLILIAIILNFFWKISIHMLAVGGVTGIFLGLSFKMLLSMPYLIIALIFISGLIGYSRIILKQHRSWEIYAGYLIGFLILFSLYMLV